MKRTGSFSVFAYEGGDMDYTFRKVRLILSRLFADDAPEEGRMFIHNIDHDVEWNSRIFSFLKQIPSFSLSGLSKHVHFWELSENPIFVPFKKNRYKMSEMAEVPVE